MKLIVNIYFAGAWVADIKCDKVDAVLDWATDLIAEKGFSDELVARIPRDRMIVITETPEEADEKLYGHESL